MIMMVMISSNDNNSSRQQLSIIVRDIRVAGAAPSLEFAASREH